LFLRVSRVFLIAGLFCGDLATQIQLVATTSPSSLQVSESGRLLISLMNTNPASNTVIHPGDVLQLKGL